jgi:hypothetical protein
MKAEVEIYHQEFRYSICLQTVLESQTVIYFKQTTDFIMVCVWKIQKLSRNTTHNQKYI